MIPGQAQQFFEAAAAQSGASAFEIERSVRLNDGDSAYLNRTPSSAGNQRTFTWSGWIKRTESGSNKTFFSSATSNTSNPRTDWQFYDDTLYITFNPSGSSWLEVRTDRVFRDFSAWYHIVVAVDTTQGTNTDRVKIYVNGVRETSFSSYSTITQNLELHINSATEHAIGRYEAGDSNYFPGYLTEINFVDGQALAPTDFGETNDDGLWIPKNYTFETNPNDGTTWSDAVPTADGFRPGRAAADAFDGDLSTYCALNNYTFNLDVGSWGISGTLEVYTGANHQYAVDGGSASAMTANDWTNVGNAGSITTLTLTRTDGSYPYINC